ncbi:MAG: hypothetical protein ACE5I1_10495, partial [bacterium]
NRGIALSKTPRIDTKITFSTVSSGFGMFIHTPFFLLKITGRMAFFCKKAECIHVSKDQILFLLLRKTFLFFRTAIDFI